MNENDLLTDEEFAALDSATTAQQWNEACAAVKAARGREYPSDWYARIVAPGIPGKVAARFGGSAEIGMVARAR